MIEGGNNILHRLVGTSPDIETLDAALLAARANSALTEALETENLNGLTVLHVAAAQAEDPRTLFQLVRWGADVQRIARPVENGWLETTT